MRLLFLLLWAACAAPAGAASLRAGEIVWAPQGGPLLRVEPGSGASSPLYDGPFRPRAGVVVDAAGSILFVAQNDEVIPPDAERQFAQRMGADTIEVTSGHCAMVSHPDETYERIVAAANAVAGG